MYTTRLRMSRTVAGAHPFDGRFFEVARGPGTCSAISCFAIARVPLPSPYSLKMRRTTAASAGTTCRSKWSPTATLAYPYRRPPVSWPAFALARIAAVVLSLIW